MLTTAVDLPQIRRLEAVSFKSLPATSTYFNGSWAVRLTQTLPAKRLNSINPLDPRDCNNIKQRISGEAKKFKRMGRELIFRLSPLAAGDLVEYLRASNWISFDPSIVMTLDLDHFQMDNTVDRLPYRDIRIWVDEVLELGGQSTDMSSAHVELIKTIGANTGLFLLRDKTGPPNVHCVLLSTMIWSACSLLSLLMAINV